MKSKSKSGEKSWAKRKLSMKKKASELSTLFNAQVVMVFIQGLMMMMIEIFKCGQRT